MEHGNDRRAVSFVWLAGFGREWKRLRLTETDASALKAALGKRPEAGAVVRGGGGLRKARFGPPSRRVGKSGGFRVGYYHDPRRNAIFLIALYSKREQADLSPAAIAEARHTIELVRKTPFDL